jgi:RHS repeat-associated protein
METTAGSVTSTRQFIYSADERCEARDAGGNVLNQFFRYGETINGSTYYLTKDHLGSVREMTNISGTMVWQQSFDPYGVPTTLLSTTRADTGYADMYVHGRSGLNLTKYRVYSSMLGRWLSPDPLGEDIGTNLYTYVDNDPVNQFDRLGLMACPARPHKPTPDPPYFPDCDTGDCCSNNFDRCTTHCDYWYRGKLNVECHECCSATNIECHSKTAGGGTFPGEEWQDCFKRRPNNPDFF